jgi:hypothetical protein
MDRSALIADFVNEWGYPDPAINDCFRLDLEALISKICPQPSIAGETLAVPLPNLKPKRRIRFED